VRRGRQVPFGDVLQAEHQVREIARIQLSSCACFRHELVDSRTRVWKDLWKVVANSECSDLVRRDDGPGEFAHMGK